MTKNPYYTSIDKGAVWLSIFLVSIALWVAIIYWIKELVNG